MDINHYSNLTVLLTLCSKIKSNVQTVMYLRVYKTFVINHNSLLLSFEDKVNINRLCFSVADVRFSYYQFYKIFRLFVVDVIFFQDCQAIT